MPDVCQKCGDEIQNGRFLCQSCSEEFSAFVERQAADDKGFTLTPKGVVLSVLMGGRPHGESEKLAEEVLERLKVHATRRAEYKIPAMIFTDGNWEFIGLEREDKKTLDIA